MFFKGLYVLLGFIERRNMKGFKKKIVIDGETLGGDIYYEKMLGFWLFMSCALSKSLIIN